MTEEILNELYNKYRGKFGSTDEYKKAEKRFCGTHDYYEDSITLISAVYSEARLAFQDGFSVAVALLNGGTK